MLRRFVQMTNNFYYSILVDTLIADTSGFVFELERININGHWPEILIPSDAVRQDNQCHDIIRTNDSELETIPISRTKADGTELTEKAKERKK